MAEEIQEAVQIIRVAYDGIEIAMKVGSGGIAAMQKAIDFLKGMLSTAKEHDSGIADIINCFFLFSFSHSQIKSRCTADAEQQSDRDTGYGKWK